MPFIHPAFAKLVGAGESGVERVKWKVSSMQKSSSSLLAKKTVAIFDVEKAPEALIRQEPTSSQ
jgi:hypothetical protein